ncbi:DNA polymerase III subunit beta [Clostridium butyricum]|uniref:DNA polymerase III subunit beta n=1 Tax=Clostridium butyricum TaxID=1492 RepID=UPI002AAF5EC9|nr:DNA polymerase III subunit beta [Clostridium butyricum]
MKFIIEKSNLLENLNKVSKAITGKSNVDSLKGILIQVNDGKIIMMGSDLDLSIISFSTCEVIEPGSMLIDAKMFIDIIRKLRNDKITISSEADTVSIQCVKSKFTVVKMDEKIYPKFPQQDKSTQLSLSKELFSRMINQVAFAVAQDDSRPILKGILFELKSKMLHLVALDGYRLAYSSNPVDIDIDGVSAVIDGKSLYSISKLIDNNGDMKISITPNHIQFTFDNIIISTRLLEGAFIKYESLLPSEFQLDIQLNRIELLESIERCTLISPGNPVVKFHINESNILDITSDSTKGKANEQVVISSYTGSISELDIAFNGKYLIDILSNLEEDKLTFHFKNGVSAAICHPTNNSNIKQLILPIRLTKN